MDNPKGRVSPGEGLVKMVRVLPVRPVGEVALLGVRGAVAPGEGLLRKRALAGIRVCRQGVAGTG